MKKIIALVAALLMLVAVVGCGSNSAANGAPDKVVKAYFDALKAKDYDKAYTFWKTTTPKDQWVNTRKTSNMSYDGYNVGKPKITGDKAEVEVTIQGFPLPYSLEKVNGAWKITGYLMAGNTNSTGGDTSGVANPHAGGTIPTTPSTGTTTSPTTTPAK